MVVVVAAVVTCIGSGPGTEGAYIDVNIGKSKKTDVASAVAIKEDETGWTLTKEEGGGVGVVEESSFRERG